MNKNFGLQVISAKIPQYKSILIIETKIKYMHFRYWVLCTSISFHFSWKREKGLNILFRCDSLALGLRYSVEGIGELTILSVAIRHYWRIFQTFNPMFYHSGTIYIRTYSSSYNHFRYLCVPRQCTPYIILNCLRKTDNIQDVVYND